MAIEGLSEEMAGNEHLQGFETVDDLAGKFIELKTADVYAGLDEDVRTKIGDKTPADLAKEFVDISGKVPQVPESPDGYEFQFPEGVPVDGAETKLFQQQAQKLGLSQEQYKGLIEYDISRIARALEAYEGKVEESMQALQAETKLSGDEIKAKVETAAKGLGMEDLVKRLDLMAEPAFLKHMLKLSDMIGEDKLRLSGMAGPGLKRDETGRPIMQYESMQQP